MTSVAPNGATLLQPPQAAGRTATATPATLSVDPSGIPRELTALTDWVVWRLEPKAGKPGEWDKVPYRPSDPKRKASSTDPTTWSTFDVAFRAYQGDPSFNGVGIVLHGAGIVGIDLDNAFDEAGRVKGWARAIVDRLPGAHWERSPRGRGLRGIARSSTRTASSRCTTTAAS
jgi:primase-polymerase (primpol)-like protein